MTDDELEAAAHEAGYLLQQIQNHLGREPKARAKVRFPRGFLRTAAQGRKRFHFVRERTLQTNLAYQLILWDVYHWLLVRTDIAATAKEMVIKAALFLAGAIAESLLYDHFRGVLGRRQSFIKRTTRLVSDGVITQAVKNELDWLWEQRNRQHFFLVDRRESEMYHTADYNRAVGALMGLVDGLASVAEK